MDISVVIPLYNEQGSLPELSSWIERVMKENSFSYEIIMVDDGSTDSSWKKSALCQRPTLPFAASNSGATTAIRSSLLRIQEGKGNVVITMDADLQIRLTKSRNSTE